MEGGRLEEARRAFADASAIAKYAEPGAARLERGEHRQGAFEQREFAVARQIVMPIAVAQLRVAVGGQRRCGVLQRFGQAHADHVTGVAQAGHGLVQVGTRRLNATRDQRGRIEQRAVPVEDDQVEVGGSGHGGVASGSVGVCWFS